MKKSIALFVTAAGLIWSSHAQPVEDMSKYSIGIDYSGLWSGEDITKQNVPGHESSHHINVRYAPLPYCLFSLGLGVANFTVDTFQQTLFTGTYNISPSLGVNLYSPSLLKNIVRVTTGVNAYYFYSRNSEKSYTYSAPVITPGAGLVFSIGELVDLEAGARGNIIIGSMQQGNGTPHDFSNANTTRFYFSALIHSPSEGAYLLVDFSGSPEMDFNWTNGPAESSLGISVGMILRQPKDKRAQKVVDNPAFPGFKEIEKKTEEMEKEIK